MTLVPPRPPPDDRAADAVTEAAAALTAATGTEARRASDDSHRQRINVIWEVTQATIAMAVVLTVLWVDAHVVLRAAPVTEGQTTGLMQINVLGALVVGFYFGATNHQRPGQSPGGPPSLRGGA